MTDTDTALDDDVAVPGPDEDWTEVAHKILTGGEALSTVGEAAGILAHVEAVEAIATPVGGVLAVLSSVLMVWRALETPHRTITYQGYAYGLLRAAASMDDPVPNRGWPNPEDVDDDYSRFGEAVAKAKSDLDDTALRNRILLAMAKFGEQKVLKQVWDSIIDDDDHLLRMFTPQWPDVSPG